MSQGDFHQALRDAVEQRHSKVHPFSEAWVSGGLNRQIWGVGQATLPLCQPLLAMVWQYLRTF